MRSAKSTCSCLPTGQVIPKVIPENPSCNENNDDDDD